MYYYPHSAYRETAAQRATVVAQEHSRFTLELGFKPSVQNLCFFRLYSAASHAVLVEAQGVLGTQKKGHSTSLGVRDSCQGSLNQSRGSQT